jgi:transposase
MMRNLAWTAGFLEGDGSFSVSGADPRVSATQVELEPLNRLLSLHGGAIYPHKPAGFGKKKGHAWVLRGGKGIGLMMTLYPFMCSRRQRQIKKTILDWLSRGVTKGERHHLSTVSDVDALAAMRHVRDGRSVEVVAGSLGISRHILSYWMQGTKRSYLLKALEKEGIPSKYVYNGGRREPRHLNKEIILEAIRRVRRGESNTAVARDLDVTQGVVSLWCSGKNRPYLLEQVLEEEREALEEE